MIESIWDQIRKDKHNLLFFKQILQEELGHSMIQKYSKELRKINCKSNRRRKQNYPSSRRDTEHCKHQARTVYLIYYKLAIEQNREQLHHDQYLQT